MNKHILLLVLLLSFFNCKQQGKKKSEPVKEIPKEAVQDISAREVIKNLDQNLNNGDEVTLAVNLTMEHFVRVDTIRVKGENDEILISASINDKILDLDKEFKSHTIKWKKYHKRASDSLSLENYFSQKLNRTHKNEAPTYTAKIYTQSDTLVLYTYNLADKARFVKGYFEMMKSVFPNEKKFMSNNETFPE